MKVWSSLSFRFHQVGRHGGAFCCHRISTLMRAKCQKVLLVREMWKAKIHKNNRHIAAVFSLGGRKIGATLVGMFAAKQWTSQIQIPADGENPYHLMHVHLHKAMAQPLHFHLYDRVSTVAWSSY
ncbi:unnamed protein product [Musa banksii]